VVCPVASKTITTAEIVGRIKQSILATKATAVYIAHAGNGAPEMAGEREQIMREVRDFRFDDDKKVVVASVSEPTEYAELLGLPSAEPFRVSLVEQEICEPALLMLT
jgi:hypothetical protein